MCFLLLKFYNSLSLFKSCYFITARKRSLGQGNIYIFTPVCHSVHRGGDMCGCSWGGMHGCSGGMCGCSGGHAWFYLGGHAWFYLGGMHGFIWGGMHGFIWGVCMVLFGGHAWLYLGGMHGFFRGACMVFLGGCMVFLGSVWFFRGVHGFSGGACVVFSVFLDTMRYGQ